MKFRTERDVLVQALGTAGRAVSGRSSIQALAGVRAELVGDQLSMIGSDLDLTISLDVTVAGETDGVAVLPARLTSEIVRAMDPGAVTLSVDGDSLGIKAGRSEFNLRLISVDEFPKLNPLDDVEAVSLPSEQLAKALRQVIISASNDDSRPILTGVLLESLPSGLSLIGTDSFRLAIRDLTGADVLADGQSVLIPSRSLGELNRILDQGDEVSIKFGENEVSFAVGPVRLWSRLIEGEYPNVRGLIPESPPNELIIDRGELLDALRRVKLLAREATPIKLEMSDEGVDLVAVTQDVGTAREFLKGSYTGQDLTVGFNPQFLMEGVEVSTGEQVSLGTIDEFKPAVLRSVGETEFTYVVMPIRIR